MTQMNGFPTHTIELVLESYCPFRVENGKAINSNDSLANLRMHPNRLSWRSAVNVYARTFYLCLYAFSSSLDGHSLIYTPLPWGLIRAFLTRSPADLRRRWKFNSVLKQNLAPKRIKYPPYPLLIPLSWLWQRCRNSRSPRLPTSREMYLGITNSSFRMMKTNIVPAIE